jgi:hypothetical protein
MAAARTQGADVTEPRLGRKVLAGLAGQVAHLGEHGLERPAVVDPLPIQRGQLGRDDPRDRPAAFLCEVGRWLSD